MAITTLGLTGFEHGFIGAGAQNGGGLFDAAPGSGWSASTSSPRNGSYCAHLVAPANTATRLLNNVSGSPTKIVKRFGVKVSSRPSSGTANLADLNTGGVMSIRVSSAGVLSALLSGGTAVNGPTIDTTNWHLIEYQLDTAAKTLDWKVDGVSQTQATTASALAAITNLGLGTTSAAQPAFTADYDDVIIGTWTVAATDWYGNGKVLAQLPGLDGTHNSVTAFSPGDAGTAYSGTPTTIYTMVDDPPGTGGWTATRSTTDNLALRVATVGAIVRIGPVPTAEAGTPNAVKAIMSYSSSSATANLAACEVRNSDNVINALWGLTGGVGQDYSETTNFFKSAIVTRPSAGWSATTVNALLWRFGTPTSADISPVPTVQALMLEVDWPILPPTITSVARISLAAGGEPETRTLHKIKARARKASGSGTVELNAALYEGATNRSGDLTTTALTASLADYSLAIPDASAANITDYSDLELRIWADSPTGDAVNVEVAEIWLETPASTGPAAQNLTGVGGIVTGEAFGTQVVTRGAVGITTTGIATAEAVGTQIVGRAPIAIAATGQGIATAEAFGTQVITVGPRTLVASGIVSVEAFGTQIVGRGPVTVSPSSIASDEAFGSATLTSFFNLSVSSITSGEAFGTAQISVGAVSILPSSIGSAEAFGSAIVTPPIIATGIGSAEAFGTAQISVLAVAVLPTAIPGAEAFGTQTITRGAVAITTTGIASAEAFGTQIVTRGAVTISPTGIATAEVFGSSIVNPPIVLTGIASAEAFGTTQITAGLVTASPSSIPSSEAFGTTQVLPQAIGIVASGIPSGEAFGNQTVTLGAATVSPTGIASAEVFGSQIVTPPIVLASIPSAEAFGSPQISVGVVSVLPSSIASAEAFGTAVLQTGATNLIPAGIASAESHGTQQVVKAPYPILPGSINSAEAFGAVSLARGINAVAIPSAEMFGSALLKNINTILTTGIASAEAFGTTQILPQVVGITTSGIPSAEALGSAVLQTGAATLVPTGIASAESHGTTQVIKAPYPLLPSSISSAEAFGVASVARGIITTGIPSAEALGTPALKNINTISVTGIGSAEAFGTTQVLTDVYAILPASINSVEAFGTATFQTGAVTVSSSGIASAEAFGTAQVVKASWSVLPSSIASAEAFGTARLDQKITGIGITSAENVSAPAVIGASFLSPSAIPSAGAFGSTTVASAAWPVIPSSIASAEAVGTPQIAISIRPQSISSAEAFGLARMGFQMVVPSIASQEQFGTPSLVQVIVPGGIESAEIFGAPQISVGVVTVLPFSIGTGEAFGTLFISGYVSPPDELLQALSIVFHEQKHAITFNEDLALVAFEDSPYALAVHEAGSHLLTFSENLGKIEFEENPAVIDFDKYPDPVA